MAKAKSGDTVKVGYIGTLADGTEFDRSTEEQCLEFTLGAGKMIPGFEQAIDGMEVGESKKVTLAAAQAYGDYDEKAVVEVTRSRLPDDLNPQVGQQLQAQNENGSPVVVVVKEVSPDTVTLDANHPLAGKDLTFDLTLMGID